MAAGVGLQALFTSISCNGRVNDDLVSPVQGFCLPYTSDGERWYYARVSFRVAHLRFLRWEAGQ